MQSKMPQPSSEGSSRSEQTYIPLYQVLQSHAQPAPILGSSDLEQYCLVLMKVTFLFLSLQNGLCNIASWLAILP